MARKNCDPEPENPTITYLRNGTQLLPAEESFRWSEGDSAILSLSCDSGHELPRGEKVKFSISFNYYTTTKAFSKILEGEVYHSVADNQVYQSWADIQFVRKPTPRSKNYIVPIIALIVLISIPSVFIYFIMKGRKRNL